MTFAFSYNIYLLGSSVAFRATSSTCIKCLSFHVFWRFYNLCVLIISIRVKMVFNDPSSQNILSMAKRRKFNLLSRFAMIDYYNLYLIYCFRKFTNLDYTDYSDNCNDYSDDFSSISLDGWRQLNDDDIHSRSTTTTTTKRYVSAACIIWFSLFVSTKQNTEPFRTHSWEYDCISQFQR